MGIPNKLQVNGLEFSEGNSRDVRLPRGFLLGGLIVRGAYTDTISSAATAARTYGIPISRAAIIADGGKTLKALVPKDFLIVDQMYEQAALADILVPPTALTAAAHTGSFELHIPFAEPKSGKDYDLTRLPTWIYDELLLRIEWGDHDDVYRGGAGAVTMQSLDVTALALQGDFASIPNAFEWGRRLPRTVSQYSQVDAPGAITQAFSIDLPRTSDIRSIMIVVEDANGDGTNGIVDNITLELNDSLRMFNEVPGSSVRADNARFFGATPPTGVYILEFAEDKNIRDILNARQLTALKLKLKTTATAGTIRVVTRGIEPGPGQIA